MHILASSDFYSNLGGLFTGLASMFGLIGTAVGFLIRQRKNIQRERLRTERAASVAVQEARKKLEERLEHQHAQQITHLEQQVENTSAQAEERLDEMQRAYELQIEQYKQQVRDLTQDRERLLNRLLKNEHNHG